MSARCQPDGGDAGNAGVIRALLTHLDALGVREFCVCAGARNAPLLDVLVRRGGDITLRSFFEERSAAFFALGRVMQTQQPVAVVTTSGTAVAELYPAVMEAYYQGLPLVLVTADRPSSYRGSGAPQAVEQVGVFGTYVVREVDMEAGKAAQDSGSEGQCGPVHFNVRLEERLEECVVPPPAEKAGLPRRVNVTSWTEGDEKEWKRFWQAEGELVVLAAGLHPADVPTVRDFLLRLQAPVVAEVTSNLQGDPALAPLLRRGGEKALKALTATRVLRVGAVPSWRWWRDLEQRPEVRVLNISPTRFRGLARREAVATVPWSLFAHPQNERWIQRGLAEPVTGEAEVAGRLAELLATYAHAEPAWMRHLSAVMGSKAQVFLGNSLPIREWNLAAAVPGSEAQFFANRGANGIDGIISTWLGLSAEAEESWLVLGDLSALYDLSAPWILPQLPKARRRLVVINNGGGQIFSRLPWLKSAEEGTQRVMLNAHQMEFSSWARMWGMDYRLITELSQLVDDESPCAVWEVRPDPEQTEAFWREWQLR